MLTEVAFAAQVRALGGRAFIVGGWVRDQLRGVTAHDKDYMVSGLVEAAFQRTFPTAHKVGKAFPVYLLTIDGVQAEVAFARKERKIGQGYKGFATAYDPTVTVEEDLWRRDTTMNAMALELLPDGTRLLDPFHGREAVAARRISAVSEHFRDDPVRALRAARQAAAFGFSIDAVTYGYMRDCQQEVAAEPPERLLGELERALRTERPSIFFRALARADLLRVTFPELAALIGKTQPVAFHPEGDAFAHTLLIVDAVAAVTANVPARFAALVHDLGKGVTPPEMLPHHYGHEAKGLAVLAAWNDRMTLPVKWLQAARFVMREHMRAPVLTKPGKITALLLAIDKQRAVLSVADFLAIIQADHHGLPDYLAAAEEIIPRLHTVTGRDCPPGLRGPAIGQWLFAAQCKIFQQWKQEKLG